MSFVACEQQIRPGVASKPVNLNDDNDDHDDSPPLVAALGLLLTDSARNGVQLDSYGRVATGSCEVRPAFSFSKAQEAA